MLELLDLPLPAFGLPDQSPDNRVTVHPEGVSAYLTKIVASPLSWLQSDHERETILDLASHRLSQRSGRTGMSSLTRVFTVPLKPPDINSASSPSTLDITLHEPAMTEDNLGLKTWSSSYVLAKTLYTLRSTVSISPELPILELGAGTGLVGLAAAAVFRCRVLLTDLPVITENIARNVDANLASLHSLDGDAAAAILDWTDPATIEVANRTGEGMLQQLQQHQGKFTTIVVADPIYSPDHPKMLVGAVEQWLDRGEGAEKARLILAYPIREAYLPQIADLKERLSALGLRVEREGEEVTRDDWVEDVRVCWSVWYWQ